MLKAQLRKQYIAARCTLTNKQQQQAAKTILIQLQQQDFFTNAQYIAVYAAAKGELDLSLVIKEIFSSNKKCYLPVVTDNATTPLQFAEYTSDTLLGKNKYSINEPADSTGKINVNNLDLLLIPGVAFTLDGKRLGMGKGYYDRTLTQLIQNQPTKKVYLCGVAHTCQIADTLPLEQHDVIMDHVMIAN